MKFNKQIAKTQAACSCNKIGDLKTLALGDISRISSLVSNKEKKEKK